MAGYVRPLRQICRTACAKSGTMRWLSKSANVSRRQTIILGQSTVLLQDGLEIQELPWVIRRLDPREFPFTSMTYAADDVRKHSGDHDETFEQLLRDCATVPQVFRLLEVPGERVIAQSAAFALERICQLRASTANDDIDSFIRKAVLNELCETVARDICQIPNITLINLVRCCLGSANYEERFVECVNEEVERRIGDSAFSVGELCTLVRIFSASARGDAGVTSNIWIHLGSRYREIDESNIAEVYRVMRYVVPGTRYLWRVVDRQLQACWWKLNACDVASIAQRLTVGNYHSTATLSAFGKWLFTNINTITGAQLKDLLAMYAHFNFSDPNFMASLERYVTARIDVMDKTVVAMAMDYCRRKRYLSTHIFDVVARDFEKNGQKYLPHEVLYTLRVFGQLNYLPPNVNDFFSIIDTILSQNFNDYDSASMLEMLASFVYIERFPVNFVTRVFTPHFLARVKCKSIII